MSKTKTIVIIAMAEIMKNGFESKSYEAYSEKLRKLNADYTEEDIKSGWDEASKKVRALYESAEKVVPSEFSIDYDKFFSEFEGPVLMDDEESDIIRIADLFAESSKSRIVFSTKENSWFVYQNGVWHSDQKKNFVYRFAADFVNALKNAYIDLLKYDFSVSGKIFYELLESEPIKRPAGDTYVLKLDSEARSTLLSVLSAFRSYNCTQYARRVGRSFSAVDYHINKKEFFIQFNELTGHNES